MKNKHQQLGAVGRRLLYLHLMDAKDFWQEFNPDLTEQQLNEHQADAYEEFFNWLDHQKENT